MVPAQLPPRVVAHPTPFWRGNGLYIKSLQGFLYVETLDRAPTIAREDQDAARRHARGEFSAAAQIHKRLGTRGRGAPSQLPVD